MYESKRTLRQVWGERHARGLENVLKEINIMLMNGDCDVEEWRQIRIEDPAEAKPRFNDWSPASVFGTNSDADLPESIRERVAAIMRTGESDVHAIFAQLSAEFGLWVDRNASSVRDILEDVSGELENDDEYLAEEAQRVRNNAVKVYAAEAMQAVWRRYQFRQRLKFSNVRLIIASISNFQGIYRKLKVRRALEREKAGAIKAIQRAYTNYRKRVYEAQLEEVYQHQRIRLLQNVSAKKIQRTWRSHQHTKTRTTSAAISIQCFFRLRKAKKLRFHLKSAKCKAVLGPLIKKRVDELHYYMECVSRVQRFWRKARVALAARRFSNHRAAKILQRLWRACCERKLTCAVIRIQTLARQALAKATRKFLTQRKVAKQKTVLAAVLMQSLWRGRKARFAFRRLQAMLALRREREQLAYLQRCAASKLNSWLRMLLAKAKVQRLLKLKSEEQEKLRRERLNEEQRKEAEKRILDEKKRLEAEKMLEEEKKRIEADHIGIVSAQLEPETAEDDSKDLDQIDRFNSGRLYGKTGSRLGDPAKRPILRPVQQNRHPRLPLMERMAAAENQSESLESGRLSSRQEIQTNYKSSIGQKSNALPTRLKASSVHNLPQRPRAKERPLPQDNYSWSYRNQMKQIHRQNSESNQAEILGEKVTPQATILDKLGRTSSRTVRISTSKIQSSTRSRSGLPSLKK